MPEGPEVRLLVDKLNKKLKTKKITNIKILGGKYLRKNADFSKLLGLTIKSIKNYGKFIYWGYIGSISMVLL
jgi:formamidopyrimidine-DNA glycosylase